MTTSIVVLNQETSLPTVPILTPEQAQKLADLYLPVRLRNFYVCAHPLIQSYLYDSASCPEEFFVLVDQEFARFERQNQQYNRRYNRWEPVKMKSVPVADLFSALKKLSHTQET